MGTHGAVAEEVLKIGSLGVMSGPAAGWGGVMCQTAQTHAAIVNDDGGVLIGDQKYKIEIECYDTRMDPKVAQTGAERLVSEEGIRYVLGPNVDSTAASVKPVMEANASINFPYAFSKELYEPPASNSVLGMVASYQVAPLIYEYMRDERGVKTIAFIARNDADPLNQRTQALKIAEGLGLEVVVSDLTYEPGTTDFFPIMTNVVAANPDQIVLTGVAPSDVGPLIKATRELGYEGEMSTETGQDPAALCEVAGAYADGFIAAGGASTEEIRSEFMAEFIDRYSEMWGEWNDVAALYVYAPEILLQTLQAAGPEALDDVEKFKAMLDTFSGDNPFLKDPTPMRYVGRDDFGQARQVSVPVVVQYVEDCAFKPLFLATLSD
ncbi:MAG: ABC transporter substrate-binding protein [Alphaproteobacteria bacterium]|nr:ABC transporter substrate-binding protein [Alphaproteobacteria bacterium]